MSEHTTPKPKRPGCTCSAGGSVEGCYHHDPKNAAKRTHTASRAARSKASPETRAVRKLVDELTTKALEGALEPQVVHAVVALQNTKLRAIEVERKIEENDFRMEFENLKAVLAEHGVLAS